MVLIVLFVDLDHFINLFLYSCFLSLVLESLPPARYKETLSALLAWIQQCEAKLSIPSTAVTEYPIMEQRLNEIQVHTQQNFVFLSQ